MIRLSFNRCAAAVVALFLAMPAAVPAYAAGCSSPNAGEIASLQRQIAANRVFEAKHGCTAGGGFACREIARRISVATMKLASLQVAAPSCAAPAVAVRKAEPRAARVAAQPALFPTLPEHMETRCVRLSDGYYFPTPNSGFSTAGDVAALAAQCRFICEDPAMDVYRVGADRDADTMISLTTGTTYADLPHAGAYRTAAVSKTCDMNRFYKAALAGKHEPPSAVAENAEPATVDAATEPATQLALWNDTPLRGTRSLSLDLPKKVRVVGALYLPEE